MLRYKNSANDQQDQEDEEEMSNEDEEDEEDEDEEDNESSKDKQQGAGDSDQEMRDDNVRVIKLKFFKYWSSK
jgi:hypothetical protein